MPRTPVWKSIAATLTREIADGLYPEGGKLPTEAALATRFGVNRHTVRRALADMSESGVIHTRRGAGAFVTAVPTDYAIGKRTRFHHNIEATGKLAHKRALRIETRPGKATEADALGIAAGEPVTVYEGLSMSGKTVLAHFESIFPAARLPGLAESFETITSVTEALAQNGIADYLRRDTRILAELASATEALHLGIREGDPILRSVSVNITPDGAPIEYGITRFAGARVALTVKTD